MKTIYIAGPMTGKPMFNYQAFLQAQMKLQQDYIIVSPISLVTDNYDSGLLTSNKTGCTKEAVENYGFDLKKQFLYNLDVLMNKCDAIYMLDGWQDSLGAKIEFDIAMMLKLELIIIS